MAQPAQDSSQIVVLPPNTPAVRPPPPLAGPQAVPAPAPSGPPPSVPAPARPAPAVAAPATPAPPAPASVAASSPAPARPKMSGPGRRTPPRLRVFFLRHFRACGEVKQAAERTGVAVSTLYRWRDRDESFRERWDSLADQRRQAVEDRLMSFVQEGEKTAVFYKGEQVGWRYSHTARAAIAALAYFDRREKAAQAAAAREEARPAKADQERAVEERMRERALASRSEAAPQPKEAVKSDTSPAPAPRKIGNGPADVPPAPAPSPPPSPSTRPPQMDDAATFRRITQEFLHLHAPAAGPQMLPDNWKPYGVSS